jgi:Uma2 family endonuclease
LYRSCGVPLVWIIDPDQRTVIAFRSDGKPTLFNDEQDLTADPRLPGLRVPVRRLFE